MPMQAARTTGAGSESAAEGASSRRDSALTTRAGPQHAVSKLTGEHCCQAFWSAFGLEAVCLRYSSVFGPRQDPNSQCAAARSASTATATRLGISPTWATWSDRTCSPLPRLARRGRCATSPVGSRRTCSRCSSYSQSPRGGRPCGVWACTAGGRQAFGGRSQRRTRTTRLQRDSASPGRLELR